MTEVPSFGSLAEVQFADPRAIVARALRQFLPAERVDVADYAAAHRFLNNRGGGFVGKWNHDEAPYLVGPMQALTSRTHLTTAIVGPGRSGKTTVGQNWMLQSVGNDPADMLVYGSTEAMIEAYVKAEIEPMIDGHKELAAALGKGAKARSMAFKNFRSMWVQFLAATYSNLINKSAGRIIITELDACDDKEGDPYKLADIRRQTFGYESMVLAESHPDRAAGLDPQKWTAGIMRLYADSDRRVWYWPCPHCNGFSSPNPTASRVMTLDWPENAPLDEIRDAARMACPCCGALIEDKWRRAMNRDGIWVGRGQAISIDGDVTGDLIQCDTAGFWITGLMSPFIIGGIGSLARARVEAERALERGDDDALQNLKDVIVKRWGLPFDPPGSAGVLDGTVLADRVEPDLVMGTVPAGVRFLTSAVDVQASRFEIMTRGWGENGESWIVDHQVIDADPAKCTEDWDDLIDGIADRLYPLATDAQMGMRVMATGYDSGGEAGVTTQAYDAWRRAKKRGKARKYGMIGGREAWSLLPLKGASSLDARSIAISYPDSQRKDRLAGARGEVPLGIFNPNRMKDDVNAALQSIDPGSAVIHFPADLRSVAAPHAFFEQIVAENRRKDGRWEKKTSSARNEALDLLVMTGVMARIMGINRMDWSKPPLWAEQWDRNSMVKPIIVNRAPVPAPAMEVVPGPAPSRPSMGGRRRWAT
ncbi:phage terminase large subunit family protein [Gluconacetobacter azotocaptans]|uniref:Phage terminase large subunit family protein n=1 Tax=Gluconacetobacter azotocaptans TaxID=142834 RepID=A0A7W4JR45_9PROT|nr:terminase gpA endonuclease subunit [Gluconacetobacter azotocaptans]MBB2189200.1 phage terminase large subunit family protein [Gluconacetobacter azotocaptans]GBQ32233.1 bacteriophage terminase large subunit [Gluconacetobacter azotocaptans DSM 13594]